VKGTNDTRPEHFYIDTSPPDKIRLILHALDSEMPLTIQEMEQLIVARYGPLEQKMRSEWPRRLADLGLATQQRIGGRLTYRITSLGQKVCELDTVVPELYPELMHYLHFSRYVGTPGARGYLWSYRQCSKLAWREKRIPPSADMASRVQSCMQAEFPDLDYQADKGARFDSTAASRWLRWIAELRPSPLADDRTLKPRIVNRCELVLLALDDTYRDRRYRYGDPVILDDELLDQIASVFFLDLMCCRELIDLASRTTRLLELSDSFGGTSIKLLEPYGIDRI